MRIYYLPSFLVCLPLAAQILPDVVCVAPQQPETILLHLSAENLNVPGSPGWHLRVSPMPTGTDIQVSDRDLKSAIQAWVDDQNQHASTGHPWVLDGRNPWTFFKSGLGLSLSSRFTITFPTVFSQPTGAGTQTQPVKFCAVPLPAVPITQLKIQIATPNYDPAKPHSSQPLSAQLDTAVTGTALLGTADAPETAAIADAFARVAEQAWAVARQYHIVIASTPNKDTVRDAMTAIVAVYSLKRDNISFNLWGQWPELRALLEHTVDGKCCVLSLENVQIAHSALIQVEANFQAAAPPPSGANPSTPGGITDKPVYIKRRSPEPGTGQQGRADKLANNSQDALNRRFAISLAAFHNTVPTFAQVDAVRSNLAVAREIKPGVRLGILDEDHQVIVFDADNRWTKLNINLTAGGGYSVEDKGTGKLDLQAENLLFQTPDQLYPQESESLSYAGGNEVQKASGNWNLSWTRPHKNLSQSTFGPHLDGDFSQDQNQRFGNPLGPILRDHEIGWKPGFDYIFTSATVDQKGNPPQNLFALNLDTGIRQRWFRITPATGDVFPARSNGMITDYSLSATPSYHFVPLSPKHLGGFDLTAAAQFLKGLPAGDFAFTQVQASLQGTLYFGGANVRDFLVRFRKGMGTSNGATPLPFLFRLGGTDNTRGVEQGEQVGREIAFEQSEAGVSFREIVSWFNHPLKTAQTDQAPKSSPVDLTKIYLKAFYDRGRVTNNTDFAGLFAFSHGAKGYGIAVELAGLTAGSKRITLSIGYARSPDSVLHSNGVPITAANIDF